MRKKTDMEMERLKIIKAARTLIRLKHSLLAEQEINDLLPDTLLQFDDAVANGTLLQLKTNLAESLGA